MKIAALMVGLLLAAANAGAAQWADSAALTRAFKDAGVTGTFVLYEPIAKRFS